MLQLSRRYQSVYFPIKKASRMTMQDNEDQNEQCIDLDTTDSFASQ